MRDEFPEFEITSDAPIYFTGEMVRDQQAFAVFKLANTVQIFSWMFEDYSELRKIQDVANRVAADSDWPALFDEEQLSKNEVPVYAAVYQEDVSWQYSTSCWPLD
jgi:hypothetical protein